MRYFKDLFLAVDESRTAHPRHPGCLVVSRTLLCPQSRSEPILGWLWMGVGKERTKLALAEVFRPSLPWWPQAHCQGPCAEKQVQSHSREEGRKGRLGV